MGRTFRCCKMAVKRRNPSYIRARCTWWTRVESPFLWLVVFITWAWKELVVPHPRLPSICFVLTGLTYSLPRAHVVALSDFCLQLLCCFFFFFFWDRLIFDIIRPISIIVIFPGGTKERSQGLTERQPWRRSGEQKELFWLRKQCSLQDDHGNT